jgi:hypothetical protein
MCYTFEDLQKPAGEGHYFENHVTAADVAREMHIGVMIGDLMSEGHSLEEAERIARAAPEFRDTGGTNEGNTGVSN